MPKEVRKIRITEPAYGGSNCLIGAYQYLLDWRKDFYTGNDKQSKGNKNNPLTPTGDLSAAEKKRILINNIYGVDLDGYAVEATKLSLLLEMYGGRNKGNNRSPNKTFPRSYFTNA